MSSGPTMDSKTLQTMASSTGASRGVPSGGVTPPLLAPSDIKQTPSYYAIAQLRAAIDRSGLSASAYARSVLIRDPRTVRRWLSGTSPIPDAVREYLAQSSMTSG